MCRSNLFLYFKEICDACLCVQEKVSKWWCFSIEENFIMMKKSTILRWDYFGMLFVGFLSSTVPETQTGLQCNSSLLRHSMSGLLHKVSKETKIWGSLTEANGTWTRGHSSHSLCDREGNILTALFTSLLHPTRRRVALVHLRRSNEANLTLFSHQHDQVERNHLERPLVAVCSAAHRKHLAG